MQSQASNTSGNTIQDKSQQHRGTSNKPLNIFRRYRVIEDSEGIEMKNNSHNSHHEKLVEQYEDYKDDHDDDDDDEHEHKDTSFDHESLGLVSNSKASSSDSITIQQRWRKLRVTDDDEYLTDDVDDFNSEDGGTMYDYSDGYFVVAPNNRKIRICGICIVLIAVSALLIPRRTKKHNIDLTEPFTTKKIKGTPQYTCPFRIDWNDTSETYNDPTSTTEKSDNLNDNYDLNDMKIKEDFAIHVSNDINYYKTNFRTNNNISGIYDEQWLGRSYIDMKENIRLWKKEKFLYNLKTGNSIYESGSVGIGFNLLLTLEILQEENNNHYITDLHVYGNDYEMKSVEIANLIMDDFISILSTTNIIAKLGVICPIDSTSLTQFIPNDSFDLVFTSFISPLPDPLQLNTKRQEQDDNNDTTTSNNNQTASTSNDTNSSSSSSKIESSMNELCNNRTSTNDWMAQTLIKLAQDRQDDWFNLWVNEMIQIAKPGVPVIIEYVGQPYCYSMNETDDNDNNFTSSLPVGVSKSFWTDGITRYNWDIDPNSIEIQDDILFPSRYHVFMRKNSLQ